MKDEEYTVTVKDYEWVDEEYTVDVPVWETRTVEKSKEEPVWDTRLVEKSRQIPVYEDQVVTKTRTEQVWVSPRFEQQERGADPPTIDKRMENMPGPARIPRITIVEYLAELSYRAGICLEWL